MVEPSSPRSADDFKLERYKFILKQIHFLNENVHKYLNLFQALYTGIVGAGVAVFVGWKKLGISAEVASTSISGLVWLLAALGFFVVISLVTSVFAWRDYRQAEVELLNEAVGQGFREPPDWKNFWRWQETYLLLAIVVVVTCTGLFVHHNILPQIH